MTRLFADLGLPELTVTATDEGFTLSASEVEAGRYLVTVINESSAPDAIVLFARLTDGRTLADLSFADELAAGTPMPEEGPPPESYLWLFESYLPGGTVATADTPGHVVVDLRGGDYGVWTLEPIPAAALTVTGDPDARIEGPEPEAAVTIVEEGVGGEGFRFTVNGEAQAGPQVIKVLNASDQPHEVIGEQYPDPLTMEQILGSLMFDPSTGATPPPDLVDEERLTFVRVCRRAVDRDHAMGRDGLLPGPGGLPVLCPRPGRGGHPARHGRDGQSRPSRVSHRHQGGAARRMTKRAASGVRPPRDTNNSSCPQLSRGVSCDVGCSGISTGDQRLGQLPHSCRACSMSLG